MKGSASTHRGRGGQCAAGGSGRKAKLSEDQTDEGKKWRRKAASSELNRRKLCSSEGDEARSEEDLGDSLTYRFQLSEG